MATDESSDNSESNKAIMGFEAVLWATADKLRNNLDRNKERKKQIRLLGLNLGIAAADIITFSLVDFWASALAIAFGSTIIFLSVTGVIYGNYRILTEQEKVIPIPTPEYYIEALKKHRGSKTFEETIKLAIDQIVRLQKKNKKFLDILPQSFSGSEITCDKFAAPVAEMKDKFFMNIQNILNNLDIFDDEDYKPNGEGQDAGGFSPQINEDKFKVYNEYVTYIKDATEDNEQILLWLDKLLLGISNLNCSDIGQRDQMAAMIDDLIEQLKKHYKK
jgi:hypothetical protein